MTTRELKKLNNYQEFKTDEGINNIIQFIQRGIFPNNLNERQIDRYDEKFGARSSFVVRNQILFYNPNALINLEVVRPNQRQIKTQEVYDDITRGLGKGLNAFYHQVAMSFLNITKKFTDEFLRNQSDYKVGIVPHKLVNKPITARTSNERWAIDLIDMTAYPTLENQEKKHILTAVDYFSGKVFARSILNRENNNARPTISNALNDICVNEAHTFPRIIQGDGEFNVGALRNWYREHNIQFIKTTSYMPNSNGKVERMNREVRRKIKAGFVRSNTLIWNNPLQDYIQNINNQQSSKNHLTPNQLYTEGYNPRRNQAIPPQQPLNDAMNLRQRQAYQEAFVDNRARQYVALGRPNVFQVGDLVRIKLLVLNARMRYTKEHRIGWNKIAVHYSPQIYQVVRTIHNAVNGKRRDEYILEDENEDTVMSGGVPRRFFGNDLILVPPNYIDTHIDPKTTDRAIFINRLQR